MPKGEPIPHHILQEILERFDAYRKQGLGLMEAYEKVGNDVGRSQRVIGVIINRMRPTVGAARLYLRSKALRMARRVVSKGTTAELINILERPSIGVLEPLKKAEAGGGGFFLSVSADSCGAVKVGIAAGQAALPPAPVETFDPYQLQPGDQHENEEKPVQRFVGRSIATQTAIENARIRLENARQRRGREEDGRVQGADVESETAGGR